MKFDCVCVVVVLRHIQDPASQRLTWNKPPVNVLVIRKIRDESLVEPFKELCHFLVEVLYHRAEASVTMCMCLHVVVLWCVWIGAMYIIKGKSIEINAVLEIFLLVEACSPRIEWKHEFCSLVSYMQHYDDIRLFSLNQIYWIPTRVGLSIQYWGSKVTFHFHVLQEKGMLVFVERRVVADVSLTTDETFASIRKQLCTFREGNRHTHTISHSITSTQQCVRSIPHQ